jgi:uncharacterized protein
MGSDTYHEPLGELSQKTRELHRGIVSLIEELEAIDWYQQRADACTDEALKRVLVHNKNEEIEHAAMTLEWLRRNWTARCFGLRPCPARSSCRFAEVISF